jgi:hypothetical protein
MRVVIPSSFSVRLLCAFLGASSIATLLLYFYGVTGMAQLVVMLLVPAVVILVVVVGQTRRPESVDLHARIIGGLWAGGFATLAYDVVRLPIALAGLPIFKAISYFGTLITNQSSPTVTSEVVGWSYHLSNGIGFGLMYAVLVGRPRWWTAVIWGVTLEAAMLLTPYAEIFGYKLSGKFVAITLSSHVVYGIALWAALRPFSVGGNNPPRIVRHALLKFLPVPLGVGAVGAAFFAQHSASIPPPPPPYLGKHLYVTWNVPEPDRFAGMWVLKKFVDPEARFYFIEPYSHFRFGTSFDMPEAQARRSASRSVTEVLLTEKAIALNEKLKLLGRMSNLYEVAQWMKPSDPAADTLGRRLVEATSCSRGKLNGECAELGFRFLDDWYSNNWE